MQEFKTGAGEFVVEGEPRRSAQSVCVTVCTLVHFAYYHDNGQFFCSAAVHRAARWIRALCGSGRAMWASQRTNLDLWLCSLFFCLKGRSHQSIREIKSALFFTEWPERERELLGQRLARPESLCARATHARNANTSECQARSIAKSAHQWLRTRITNLLLPYGLLRMHRCSSQTGVLSLSLWLATCKANYHRPVILPSGTAVAVQAAVPTENSLSLDPVPVLFPHSVERELLRLSACPVAYLSSVF